jgi:hypothetical protein
MIKRPFWIDWMTVERSRLKNSCFQFYHYFLANAGAISACGLSWRQRWPGWRSPLFSAEHCVK